MFYIDSIYVCSEHQCFLPQFFRPRKLYGKSMDSSISRNNKLKERLRSALRHFNVRFYRNTPHFEMREKSDPMHI